MDLATLIATQSTVLVKIARRNCFFSREKPSSMTRGLEPTEEYDGRVTVRLLNDDAGTKAVKCSSYEAAIRVVKDNVNHVTVAKIVERDGEVVFTSAEMDIDLWERDWNRQKRRLSVSLDAYDCPYDSISCFVDDLCVQCKMDKVQDPSQFEKYVVECGDPLVKDVGRDEASPADGSNESIEVVPTVNDEPAPDRLELLSELVHVSQQIGNAVSKSDLKAHSRHPPDAYADKFGSWQRAVEQADMEAIEFNDES